MSNLVSYQLDARELSCIRGGRVLFENCSFEVGEGEALLIRGKNGSGKTSLLRILCGLALAESGTVRWNGQDILADRFEYLSNMKYLGHLPGVKRELTVRENLTLLTALETDDEKVNVVDLAARVGLKQRLSVPCARLSAGQQRRLALAGLLITTKKLWILDEPLTALDVHFVEFIENRIQEHLDHGGIVVLTTHREIELGEYPVKIVQL